MSMSTWVKTTPGVTKGAGLHHGPEVCRQWRVLLLPSNRPSYRACVTCLHVEVILPAEERVWYYCAYRGLYASSLQTLVQFAALYKLTILETCTDTIASKHVLLQASGSPKVEGRTRGRKDLPSMYRTANVHNCFYKTIYCNDEQLDHWYELNYHVNNHVNRFYFW